MTGDCRSEGLGDGAVLVQDLDDILQELGPAGQKLGALAGAAADAAGAAASAAAIAALPPTERTLAEALAEGPLSLDELLRRTGLPTGQAASAMTMLTLKGVVAQCPGNTFHLRRGTTGRSHAK